MSIKLSAFSILSIKSVDYHCIISGISKSEAINWKKQEIIKHKNLLSHIKMSKQILTFGDI